MDVESRPFDEDDRGSDDRPLILDIDGYEGPLDLLLDLARRQKVDLTRISILALANQYLAFVEDAQNLRIELAADYLVMASWLAYLKSRLILPVADDQAPAGVDELATKLALRLLRLNQTRQAAQLLMERQRLGVDVFPCGQPEMIKGAKIKIYDVKLIELLQAYAQRRQKAAATHMIVGHRVVWSLVDAKHAIERILGEIINWSPVEPFLERFISRVNAPRPKARATIRASALSAMLEMVKEGVLELKQDTQFGPISIRGKVPSARFLP